MPVNEELYKKAMAAVGTAEDASGIKEDSGKLLTDVDEELGTPGNVDAASDQGAQSQLSPEEITELQKLITPAEGATPAMPTWSPDEHRQFTRLGLSPERLHFFQTLAGLRKGMGLESELLDRALSGQRQEFSDVEDLPVGQYA